MDVIGFMWPLIFWLHPTGGGLWTSVDVYLEGTVS
jgi:hypothetical protein